jgi:glycosyltransferase involved in cell wall biosynthesis
LEAARTLTRRLPNCRFVICGDALFNDRKARRYRQALDNLAMELPVEFLGWRDDVYHVMAQLDLLVVPSVLEPGTPRTILQAYACGLPVVAFATGGIPEIVEDGETGFLVRKITPEALAERIYRLLAIEPEKLRAAAARGRVLWSKRFSIERYQQRMMEVMRLAAGNVPTAASGPKPAPRSISRAAHG